MSDPSSRLGAALGALARAHGVPEAEALPLRRVRIVSQGIDGRVSLQQVDRSGDAADTLPMPVWYGVPGFSADHSPGQEMVLGYAGADLADPVAFLATPRGQPGHVPIRIRIEATTEVRFFAGSAGVVRVGPGTTQQVALGPALDALIAALKKFATTASSAATAPQIAVAALELVAALTTGATIPPGPPFPSQTAANKLEAI